MLPTFLFIGATMFFLKTFKAILIAMTSASMVLFLILGLFFYKASHSIEELSLLKYEIRELETYTLLLRRNEKDFLARADLKYEAEFKKNHQELISKLDKVSLSVQSHEL